MACWVGRGDGSGRRAEVAECEIRVVRLGGIGWEWDVKVLCLAGEAAVGTVGTLGCGKESVGVGMLAVLGVFGWRAGGMLGWVYGRFGGFDCLFWGCLYTLRADRGLFGTSSIGRCLLVFVFDEGGRLRKESGRVIRPLEAPNDHQSVCNSFDA
ncbi:hypothetical protein BDV95DRAFT_362480 [Massariosphaeria phaeospora]|uniref:Uncharacterized protein n=1 Tax=Massariosphaeria phaeospora TaxID=100035 RepID=A0A7C8I808_9PLEO|nr:hypothetical protein BDV95DRAFT_362480 [Massariosphaeria phaeospora]